MPKFQENQGKYDFPAREEKTLEFWESKAIFEKSLKIREGNDVFVFYEGPPTANGKPHPGHVLTRTIKDIFPRYKTMRGYSVPRKAGWDTHGLPVEIEVEKALGISGKDQIEKFGIQEFIDKCRESVWTYKADWEKMTKRLGFWVDLENAYVTYHTDYLESVWWAMKQIWKKGLLYQGHKIVPYCPRCGTPLSSAEVGQGYKQVTDPSIFVRFRCSDEENTSFLAWTTTPWTLISNAACAVGADFDYAYVKMPDGETLIMAEALVEKVLGKDADVKIIKTVKGSELVGRDYQPLFEFSKHQERCHYIVAADFVSLSDGSGIVHMAPAFGEDDYRVGQKNGLPVIQLVKPDGTFPPEVTPWAGTFVKDADKDIIKDLKSRGLLFKRENYKHDYPFCWRCDCPLLYYARTVWFIKTTEIAEKMLESNQAINWLPGHIKEGRFGEWLRGNVDWAVSRERFWGSPLNIWMCDSCTAQESVDSVAELREKAVDPAMVPEDFDPHKPRIDAIKLNCPVCSSQMTRTPEVIDCWFDAGAMPFAQHGYPHKNQELFKKAFPCDFISEAVDQTRGWFYTLLAISTLLFDEAPPHPYKTCLVLGHVCDEKGFKMSKSKKNYLDPWEIFNVNGADAMRWYFCSANAPWVNTRFYKKGVGEQQRDFMVKLLNVYSFFVIYANIDGFEPKGLDKFPGLGQSFEGASNWRPTPERSEIDRWMKSELNLAAKEVTAFLDAYDVNGAADVLSSLVESLSNWYVRRNRQRFWRNEKDADKFDAYWTLYESLVTITGLAAPFVPFLAEDLYQNLVRTHWSEASSLESVHLCDWPEALESEIDSDLAARMKLARDLVVLGRAARAGAKIKNRQPLSEAVVILADSTRAEQVEALSPIIREELNVKSLRLAAKPEEYVHFEVVPNFKTVGPKYGQLAQKIRGTLAARDGGDLRSELRETGMIVVTLEDKRIELLEEDLELRVRSREGFAAADDAQAVVALNTEVNQQLRSEMLRQEVVVAIQAARKDMDLKYEERIATTVASTSAEVLESVKADVDYIKSQTLSDSLEIVDVDALGSDSRSAQVDGQELLLLIKAGS
jgi:isoleucyl-tRNA synthetase